MADQSWKMYNDEPLIKIFLLHVSSGNHLLFVQQEFWRIQKDNPNELLQASAISDTGTTKTPPTGEFFRQYNTWVGGTYPNHCIVDISL